MKQNDSNSKINKPTILMQKNNDELTKELVRTLTPRMMSFYLDDVFVVTMAKAYPYIRDLLEEGMRSRVSESNLGTIAPVLLAINYDLKLIELFANRGFTRIAEIKQEQEQRATTPEQ